MSRKIFKSFICGCALVCAISACATVKNFTGFFGFMNMGRKQVTEKNLTTFAHTIRPVSGNPESHYLLARYYQERGNHSEAIIEFEKTLAIDPGNVKALNAMGVSYDYLKEFERASGCYQAALKLDPDSAGIYYNNMGQSLLLQGKYMPAIEAFKKAAACDKDFPNTRIHNNLGRAYALAGRYDLAVAEFERISGIISAEALLDRILLTAEKPPPDSVAMAATAEEETKTFIARVSRFLQERAENNVRDKNMMSAQAPQKPPNPELAADVCVEVQNGNGVDFSARNMRDSLIQKGIRVTRVTDGIHVQQTCIYYEKGYAEEAKALAGQIPVVAKLKEVQSLEPPRIKLRLLLGKDMVRNMGSPSPDSSPVSSWIGA